MLTTAKMLQYAKSDRKNAAAYAGFAEFAEGQCRWYFKQRGKFGSPALWGDESINVTRWEYCRLQFLQNRREVRDWRRLATRLLAAAEWWEKMAAAEKARTKSRKSA